MMRALAVLLIRLYQLALGPLSRGACRYSPSCSEYAREAITRHGLRGVWLAVKRISRCHPLGAHGYDPVP
jgi:putative membrane protein insertion efficiency factor